MQEIKVEVRPDFLERQAKAQPIPALAELIWNGLDADPQRRLIQKGARMAVGVKTWGEVLEENNARLQFVKEKLEHRVDDGQALAYLQERHREFLEGILIEGEEADNKSDAADNEPATAEAGTA